MRSNAAPSLDWVAIALGLLFAFLWSSAFTAAKTAVADAPPFALLAIRFAFAGAVVVLAARLMGEPWPEGAARWKALALLGLCQNALYLGLNFYAMTAIPAGVAAIIASSLPLWVAAADHRFFGERLSMIGALSLALGFAGVVLATQGRLGGEVSALAFALCVFAVWALAAATLLVRHADLGSGKSMTVGLQMLAGSLMLIPAALFLDPPVAWRFTPSLAIAFAYMVIAPGILATLVWFELIRRIGAARAAAFHFLNPGLGVLIAWAVLGETLDRSVILGVVAAALGILVLQWSKIAKR